MTFRHALLAPIFAFVFLASFACGQQICVEYHYIPKTVFEQRPVTKYRWETETVYETSTVRDSVPVYSTEQRERVTVKYEPRTTTKMVDKEFVVERPITETRYRDETYTETVMETSTEMRDQEYVVEKPISETRYREERVLVRKPVRRTEMQYEDVTTYRPVQTSQTELVPTTVYSNQLVANDDRARLEWLKRGYHWDATQGKYVYRRPGLHWTKQPSTFQNLTTATPALVAQQRNSTAYLAETTRREKPVDIIEYQEQIETRRIPYEYQSTQRTIETRKVPIEVERPRQVTKTRRVPYEVTRMVRETETRQVPVEETTMQRVESVEPYEKVNVRYVDKAREIRTPKTVRRRVPYQVMESVPRTIWMKVPVDAYGNIIGEGVPVESSVVPTSRRSIPEYKETVYDRPMQSTSTKRAGTTNNLIGTSVLERTDAPVSAQRIDYDNESTSIIVPETAFTADSVETEMTDVAKKVRETSEKVDPNEPVRQKPIRIQGEFEPGDSDDDSEDSAEPTIDGPDDDLDKE